MRLVGIGLALLSAVVSAAPQQRRDVPVAVIAGTGSIRGVVLSSEATPRPVRRARVVLQGAPQERVEITDDQGAFLFERLPPATYTLVASKPAYLPATYGALKPDRSGTSIVLADKQAVDVSMSMVLGAVVTGVVRDARGRPMADVDVGVMPVATPEKPRPALNPVRVRSDDRGTYRIFGVPPGRYYVAAVSRVFLGGGVAGRRSVEEIDAIFAQLQQRSRDVTAPLASDVRAQPLPLGPATAFAAVIHPGTTRIDSATPIALAAGEERSGIDFAMTNTRVSAIEGTVSGGVSNLDRVELNLMPEGPQISASSRPLLVQPPDKNGRFRYENVLPGRFSILARATSGEGDPEAAKPIVGAGSASGAGSSVGRMRSTPLSGEDFVYGRAEVEINDGATGQVSIALMPGATMSGSITLDRASAPVPDDLTKFGVQVLFTEPVSITVNNNTAIGNQFMGLSGTPFRADGTWQVRGIPPGAFTLFPFMPEAWNKVWWLRSAVFNGRDLLDGPFDVQSGQDMAGIAFTFTDRHSELGGTLTTSAGRAATDYFIIVCPSDSKLWTPGSRRVKSLRPNSDGSFSVKDLPAGDYLIAALTDVAPGEWNDPQWLAGVAPAGVAVKVTDGAKTVQNLKIGGGS